MWQNIDFKYNYYHKFKMKVTKRNKILNLGCYGLKALESGFINLKEFKAIIFFLKKSLKKTGKIWININPNYFETKKPIETRMGKGKGNFVSYLCFVPEGKIILEIDSVNVNFLKSLLKSVLNKISLKVRVISNII